MSCILDRRLSLPFAPQSIQLFPPGSLERNWRRVATLDHCRAMMAGRVGDTVTGTGRLLHYSLCTALSAA